MKKAREKRLSKQRSWKENPVLAKQLKEHLNGPLRRNVRTLFAALCEPEKFNDLYVEHEAERLENIRRALVLIEKSVLCMRGERNALFTLQRYRLAYGDTVFEGLIHSSDDAYKTLCGLNCSCYGPKLWRVHSSDFSGQPTCDKCLKILDYRGRNE